MNKSDWFNRKVFYLEDLPEDGFDLIKDGQWMGGESYISVYRKKAYSIETPWSLIRFYGTLAYSPPLSPAPDGYRWTRDGEITGFSIAVSDKGWEKLCSFKNILFEQLDKLKFYSEHILNKCINNKYNSWSLSLVKDIPLKIVNRKGEVLDSFPIPYDKKCKFWVGSPILDTVINNDGKAVSNLDFPIYQIMIDE